MNDPIISVVIPVYNAAQYLRRCLESVKGQTFKEIEIICVDDGSTDDSYQILEEYQNKDDRFLVLRQSNQYAGAARNHGMEIARGKYIIFWDADDCFSEDALQSLYSKAEETDADVVVCNSVGWDIEQKQFIAYPTIHFVDQPPSEVFSWMDMPDSIFQFTGMEAWNKLLRTDFLRKKGIRFALFRDAEDCSFVCIVLIEAERISFIDKKLIVYSRYVDNSLGNTKSLSWENAFRAVDLVYEEIAARGKLGKLRRSFDNFALEYLTNALVMLDRQEAGCPFFVKLKTETIEKYQLDKPESYYYSKLCYGRLQRIKNCSVDDYFFKELQWYRKDWERFVGQLSKDRFEMNFHLTCSWLYLHQKGKTLQSWFQDNMIHSVGIYGLGDIGKLLEEELRQIGVVVVYAIDREAESIAKRSYPVYGSEMEQYPTADVIIVSTISIYWDIVELLRGKVHSPIYSLEDIITYCLSGEKLC